MIYRIDAGYSAIRVLEFSMDYRKSFLCEDLQICLLRLEYWREKLKLNVIKVEMRKTLKILVYMS